MASSPQDPEVGLSLRLERRSGRLSIRRVRWRSDWTPVSFIVLLLAVLLLLSMFLPRNGAVERIKEAAQNDNRGGAEYPSVVGALTEP